MWEKQENTENNNNDMKRDKMRVCQAVWGSKRQFIVY